MAWFVAIVLVLLVATILIVILNRFYHKGSRDRTLIRTGAGGQKIVMDAGCLVLPFLHQVEVVDMRTVYIDISLHGEKSLITGDRLRVDINVSFHVRVVPTLAGIATAAQTIGARSLSAERLGDFLHGRFIDALQAVAATRTMDDLHENRHAFASEVAEILRLGMEDIGLRLESISVTQFDQTPFAALDENNAFNAVGMRRLAEIIATNRRERKEIEANADTAVRRTELENIKNRLALELEREEAESVKNIKTEQLNAEISRRTAEEREQAESASGRARLVREGDLRRAEIERDQDLRQKEVLALQAVEEARINSQIELAVRRSEEAIALSKAELSRKSVIAAEEEVKHEKERLTIESDGVVAALKADQEAALALAQARGAATAAMVNAENEDKIASLQNERQRKVTAIRAEERTAMIAAENTISAPLIAMKLEEHRMRILPEMAANMARPLKKIGEIRINNVSGLSGKSKRGRNGSGLGSAVDDILDLAFRMPAIRKLGEAVGTQIIPEPNGESDHDDKSKS